MCVCVCAYTRTKLYPACLYAHTLAFRAGVQTLLDNAHTLAFRAGVQTLLDNCVLHTI